ncbi:esterase, partial [Mycobacterium sp. ITM-2017-0098]
KPPPCSATTTSPDGSGEAISHTVQPLYCRSVTSSPRIRAGGGFESEANILHWSDYAQMARETGATVLVPIYPLAPPKSTGT